MSFAESPGETEDFFSFFFSSLLEMLWMQAWGPRCHNDLNTEESEECLEFPEEQRGLLQQVAHFSGSIQQYPSKSSLVTLQTLKRSCLIGCSPNVISKAPGLHGDPLSMLHTVLCGECTLPLGVLVDENKTQKKKAKNLKEQSNIVMIPVQQKTKC